MLFLIGGLICLNLTLFTTNLEIPYQSLSKIKSALAYDYEYGIDNHNKIDDPYECEDISPDGTNLLEGYTGNHCIQVWVCPGCYCFVVSCD